MTYSSGSFLNNLPSIATEGGPSLSEAFNSGLDLGLDSNVYLSNVDFSTGVDGFDVPSGFSSPSGSSSSSAPSGPAANPDYYVYDKGEGSFAIPMAKNLMGANLDVVSTLESVQFEAMGDSSLRNAIAYIVPWQRASSSSRSPSASSAVSAPRTNFFLDAINDVTDFGFSDPGYFDETELGFDTSFIPSWNGDDSLWSLEGDVFNTGLDFYRDDDQKGNLDSAYFTNFLNTDQAGQTSVGQSQAEKRQTAVSSEIPIGWRQGILAGGRFLADQLIEDTRIGGFVDTGLLQAAGLFDTPSGPVYIGNANGLVNQVLDMASLFGQNVPRGLTTSVPPNLQSNRSKLQGFTSSAAPSAGMWQFMFNPSELTLNAGPKFKTTETWGVSDEANTGQPLHWTHNSNAKLKFSKVLLNGYIFGKKVESLEQGLLKLFLENPTNDAKHGPKVLEFVWGKRSFGPCVIEDIKVTEKMWDEGCLVSAEVSFTLQKVPEWTINDGQTSTFDPTAHPVFSSSSSGGGGGGDNRVMENTKTSQSSGNQQTSPSAPERTQPPEEEKPRPPELSADLKECQNLLTASNNFSQLSRTIPYGGIVQRPDSEVIAAANKYVKIYGKYSKEVNSLSLDPICKAKCNYVGQVAANNREISCFNRCSRQIFEKANAQYNKKCVSKMLPPPTFT